MDLKEFTSKKTFIIAEIGKNHIQTEEEVSVTEYLDNAKELVKLAKQSGADAVKFQTHIVEDEQLCLNVTSPHFKGSDRYSWVYRNNRITPKDEFWIPLKKYCDDIGIIFFSTPMSRNAAKLLNSLDVQLWKIGSGDILDFVTLDYISSSNKPIIFSSGMSTIEEIKLSIEFLRKRNSSLVLLHCVSKYPCPPEELNLATINFYQEEFPDLIIGFSDHSIGYDSAVAAVALGAKVIEKHFSLNRDLWGSDHKVSMTPQEFRDMVDQIRVLEKDESLRSECLNKEIVLKSLGTKGKFLFEDESMFRDYFRKSLVAGQDITKGTIITKEMIYAMRPQKLAGGIHSERYEEILGKKLNKTLKKYDVFKEEYFK